MGLDSNSKCDTRYTRDRYTTDPDGGNAVQVAAAQYVDRHYEIFEAALGDGPYFLNDRFSILDIYVWMLAQWMNKTWLKVNCPKIVKLADTVRVRPKIASIHSQNFD